MPCPGKAPCNMPKTSRNVSRGKAENAMKTCCQIEYVPATPEYVLASIREEWRQSALLDGEEPDDIERQLPTFATTVHEWPGVFLEQVSRLAPGGLPFTCKNEYFNMLIALGYVECDVFWTTGRNSLAQWKRAIQAVRNQTSIQAFTFASSDYCHEAV
jgi:hypothetical protein